MIEVIHKKSKIDKEVVVPILPLGAVHNEEQIKERCEAFAEWLENAFPGDKFCYYKGQYVAGQKVGNLAKRAYEKGLITMYQSREGSRFLYWAVKIRGNN